MNKDAIDFFLESLKMKFKVKDLNSITHIEIYNDLRTFNFTDGLFNDYIQPQNLINIQLRLSSKYDNDKRFNRIDRKNNGIHFWGIENLCGDEPETLRGKLFNGIKIYIPVEIEKIYYITSSIIDFSAKENIPMQIKVAKEMRNDAITMRVTTKEDALKIERLLNVELDYNTSINPNPFLYRKGKIAFAYDGNLSYNSTLSKLLNTYLIDKKNLKLLNEISIEDFILFLRNQKVLLNGPDKQFYSDYYNIIENSRYENFLKIIEMIIGNIEGTLTLEDIFNMQKSKKIDIDEIYEYEVTIERIKKICDIADKLDSYCKDELKDNSKQKKIIEEFLNTWSYHVFPINNNIRNEVRENFTPNVLKDAIWKLLVYALIKTNVKHGDLHYENVIASLMYDSDENLNILTNEDYNRSYLCKIATRKTIKKILEEKALQYNMIYTVNNIMAIIEEETKSEARIRNNQMKK